MNDSPTVVMEVTTLEAAHLSELVQQFQDLLSDADDTSGSTADPALARLTPDPYPDDAEAGREFALLTSADLLRRRGDDAGTVLRTLFPDGEPPVPATLEEDEAFAALVIILTPEEAGAWLRTLSAIRLVLASRLGITSESDHDPDDPRYGVYEWLAMRLDGLVEAMDAPAQGASG